MDALEQRGEVHRSNPTPVPICLLTLIDHSVCRAVYKVIVKKLPACTKSSSNIMKTHLAQHSGGFLFICKMYGVIDNDTAHNAPNAPD